MAGPANQSSIMTMLPAVRSAGIIEKAEALLGQHPDVGVIYATHRTGVIRRILLGDTRYHLYYRHDVERQAIVVLAVWVARGGRPFCSNALHASYSASR
jgi:plasmid stabilization system protein ParE